MIPAEMTTKYVRSDRCRYGFLFLIKLLELNIILILLANILITELINPSNTNELMSNFNYQMTYNCVGNNNHVHQLNGTIAAVVFPTRAVHKLPLNIRFFRPG